MQSTLSVFGTRVIDSPTLYARRPFPTAVDHMSIHRYIFVFDYTDTYTGNRRSTTIIVGCGYDDRCETMTLIYRVPPQWRLRCASTRTVPEKNLNTSLST